jgi:3-oxoacyl-[acyl-carrier protein] reductase
MASSERRVALITGCGKQNGIGAAVARQLARDGIAVVVTDIVASSNQPGGWRGLESLVAQIGESGGEALAVQGDVSSEADAARMVATAVQHYGRLDILVNNAGAPQGADRNEIENVPLSAWEMTMAVNARGTFLMSRAAVPEMRKRRWGRIVSMSSVNAVRARKQRAVYGASKAAILALSRGLAMDLAAFGITVNALCPGPIETDRAANTASKDGGGDAAKAMAERIASIPVGRMGKPQDIAALISFLVSDQAGYITGQAIGIDGGWG